MAVEPQQDQHQPAPGAIGRRGHQRRWQGVGRLVVAAILGVAGIGGIAYGIYDYAEGSSDAASQGAQLGASIAAAGMGLAAVAFAAILYLKARPPKARNYTLQPDRRELRRGEPVEATLSVERLDRVRDGAQVGIVCTEYYEVTKTDGKGNQYADTEEAVFYEDWHPVDRSQSHQRHVFELPEGAPYSHEGSVVSFEWRLTVRELRPMRPDARTDTPLWVRP